MDGHPQNRCGDRRRPTFAFGPRPDRTPVRRPRDVRRVPLYFLVEAFEPFSLFRLFLGIATAALAVRFAIRGTLVAGKDGIEWHTMMRTRALALRGGERLRPRGQARAAVRISEARRQDSSGRRPCSMVERSSKSATISLATSIRNSMR